MQLGWGEEEERFRTELRVFLDEHTPPEFLDARAAPGDELLPDWARRWQATLFDHGWMVPGYPPELGGRNATPTQSVVFLEELAARGLPRSLHFLGYGIAAPSLLEFGTPQQRALASAAIRGDTVWCIGMSEPDAGSDLASLRTRAEVHADCFVVTGQKIWTSFAPVADKCLCSVRTDPDEPRHAGISALIIDMDAAGIEVRPLANIGGAAEFAEVFLDEVVVPRDALLGELNGGWRVTQSSLSHERAGMWLEAVARLERVLADLIALARQTELDGDPIVRGRLAKAYEQITCLRALGFRSLAGTAGQQLLMKLATSELYTSLLELGCNLSGPFGAVTDPEKLTDTRPWSDDLLRALAGTIAGGTSEIQRDIVAHHGLGLPRR